MIDQLQTFLATLAVIGAAVLIGTVIYFLIDLFTGHGRAGRAHRCRMPARISKLIKG
jgi:hypothetical protein